MQSLKFKDPLIRNWTTFIFFVIIFMKGLIWDELAKKYNFPYITLTKIESNVVMKPTFQVTIKIAKGLDITIDD